ncbi:hypothetical protein HYDPIDRAFT_40888 [Hydnomerulius pinastri MD-312]|uniref:RTA1-domain-containing protein n=1 Tax=Hydnomerulius pinastri MD-312 TaxID=994086 RepID=A0A0C9WEE8_9AGAM|nr:hypothetical protein HYDPIDRAFT_40888 [Hydnomerulius pinastri MD-312]
MLRLLSSSICVVIWASDTTAQATSTPQATSTTSSAPNATTSPTLVESSFDYDPNKYAAGIFGALYAIVTFILLFHLFSNRMWRGLCLPIGSAVMTAGLVLRIPMTVYPDSEAILLCSQLFILLSPAAFLAFNYILYGQFIVTCVHRRHSLIRPERTARYFVISDVATFLVQGTGGSMMSNSDPNSTKIGAYIVLGGLGLQTLSFAFYMLLVFHAYASLKRHGIKPFQEPWGMILKTLFFSSCAFMVGQLQHATSSKADEAYKLSLPLLDDPDHCMYIPSAFFYVFDSLPLLVGISTFAVFWPTKYLQPSFETTSDGISALSPDVEYGAAQFVSGHS